MVKSIQAFPKSIGTVGGSRAWKSTHCTLSLSSNWIYKRRRIIFSKDSVLSPYLINVKCQFSLLFKRHLRSTYQRIAACKSKITLTVNSKACFPGAQLMTPLLFLPLNEEDKFLRIRFPQEKYRWEKMTENVSAKRKLLKTL